MSSDQNRDLKTLFETADLAALAPPRVSSVPLPPYAYIPGRGEHPLRSPTGYLRLAAEDEQSRALLETEGRPLDWLVGVDFYNLGYFWEAHERWEGLWHRLQRRGDAADLLKALIQTAAAQIKCLVDNRRGIELLAEKSGRVLADLESSHKRLFGLEIGDFRRRRDLWFADRLLGCEIDLKSFPFLVLDLTDA